ncbi:MAG: BON domain-containing protein [Pirellulaceae bacterium]
MNAELTTENRKESVELSIPEAHAECICAIVNLPLPPPMEERARAHLTSNCPYAFCFKDIQFEFARGVLTLRGRVPTFFLKQILQTRLRNLDGVNQIDNQVDVVSATGLSSKPRPDSSIWQEDD